MNDLQQAIDILFEAERQEALARHMDERSFDCASCVFGWCEIDCCSCCELREYSQCIREHREKIARLLTEAMTGYQKALVLIRQAAATRNDEESWRLLAQVLLDIDIHPQYTNKAPKELFWEAQYSFLRLYITTGKAEYLERARMCESFRHATVCKVAE